ncbi:hypothetical protein BD310DRAFT_689350 [Dichomitus squalens]|uniref:Uncharacterized protein n=1 Tax=Dichomitus squalens TaxID=114155 RepID=A0A4Q9PMA8_9APHY|nr:hypothetical protein BD310DRAFT_689350 [Dichomitus squalens]
MAGSHERRQRERSGGSRVLAALPQAVATRYPSAFYGTSSVRRGACQCTVLSRPEQRSAEPPRCLFHGASQHLQYAVANQDFAFESASPIQGKGALPGDGTQFSSVGPTSLSRKSHSQRKSRDPNLVVLTVIASSSRPPSLPSSPRLFSAGIPLGRGLPIRIKKPDCSSAAQPQGELV